MPNVDGLSVNHGPISELKVLVRARNYAIVSLMAIISYANSNPNLPTFYQHFAGHIPQT